MADALLKNIKVNLLLYKAHQTTTAVVYQEQPFTPIKSSNEKTLRNLERGEKAEINFDLMADPDAEAGVYMALSKSYLPDSSEEDMSECPKGDNIEIITIDKNKMLPDMTEEIRTALKDKVKMMETAVNLISGDGKEHMALLSALLKLAKDSERS